MPVVIEIATFKLASDTTAEQFSPIDRLTEREYFFKQPGFISRDSASGDEGAWLVVSHWESFEEAEAAMWSFADASTTEAFRSRIDTTATSVERYVKTSPAAGLSWNYFPSGLDGFFRAPVLLTGEREALLIDGGRLLSDGRALADAIRATGRTLGTVYISQSDPDYYFGLGPVREAFPEARFIAAPATVDAINSSVQGKLDVWGPQLKENGPQKLADVVIPDVYTAPTIDLEGVAIEIVEATTLANRRHLYVPSLDAVIGGVLIFAGVHVWTADTATPEMRAAWVNELELIAARKPKIVVPGHLTEGSPLDGSAIAYTRDYLLAFEEELATARDSAALIDAMKERYPSVGMDVALELGAKVATGEMTWG